jgi:hypothetical protein
VWSGTSNGMFSVRSTFHLSKEIQRRSEGECSDTDSCSKIWKAIWSINLLNPVKVFLWKAGNNVLPT